MAFELSGQASEKFSYRFRTQRDTFEIIIHTSLDDQVIFFEIIVFMFVQIVQRADGFLFMCSLTDLGSLLDLRERYYKLIRDKRKSVSFPMYLLCNKSDLVCHILGT